MSEERHRRILLKLSGESLMGNNQFGLDYDFIQSLCMNIAALAKKNIEIAIVIGGGNIIRGTTSSVERITADHMGMMATIINALALSASFTKIGVSNRIYSPLNLENLCYPFNKTKAISCLKKGRIVIFAGGTGNPLFSTDTAAALRAIELNCDILAKATGVDGVYSADPKKDATAKKYSELSYQDIIANNLQIMDIPAISLAKDHNLPVLVFSTKDIAKLDNILNGEGSYTIIK